MNGVFSRTLFPLRLARSALRRAMLWGPWVDVLRTFRAAWSSLTAAARLAASLNSLSSRHLLALPAGIRRGGAGFLREVEAILSWWGAARGPERSGDQAHSVSLATSTREFLQSRVTPNVQETSHDPIHRGAPKYRPSSSQPFRPVNLSWSKARVILAQRHNRSSQRVNFHFHSLASKHKLGHQQTPQPTNPSCRPDREHSPSV